MAGVALVTALAMGLMMIAFWGLVRTDIVRPGSDSTPAAADQPTAVTTKSKKSKSAKPSATSAALSTPPAPASNQLVSGSWLLSQYFITQSDNTLQIVATIVNQGTTAGSIEARAFVYTDGQPVGVATADIRDLPPGTSIEVTMDSDDEWTPGNKVLYFEAVPKAD
jgi:hypothetical protein